MTNPTPAKTVGFTTVYTPAVRNVLRQLCELGLSDLPLTTVLPFLAHKDVVGVLRVKNELYGLDHTGFGVAFVSLKEA